MQTLARKRSADEKEDALVRCRALETLAHASDGVSLGILMRALAGSELEARRSASVALGEFEHSLVLPRLQTAFELEREVMTRGFLLIAIGRQGGPDACDFLQHALRKGPKALRPWSALALGVLARSTEKCSSEASIALRREYAREGNRHNASAFLLAMGIAGDESAVPVIRKAMKAGSVDTRVFAAQALSMIGGREAQHVLYRRLKIEKAPKARVAMAESLGYLGFAGDNDLLFSVLMERRDLDDMRALARAFGWLKGRDAVERLVGLSKGERVPKPVQATAIVSLGLALSRSPELVLAKLGRKTNFTLIPEWLDESLVRAL